MDSFNDLLFLNVTTNALNDFQNNLSIDQNLLQILEACGMNVININHLYNANPKHIAKKFCEYLVYKKYCYYYGYCRVISSIIIFVLYLF